MKYYVALFLILGIDLYAQCCSIGTPAGGTTNVGILDRGIVRLSSFYRYGQGSNYYQDDKNIGEGLVKKSGMNYLSFAAAYGINDYITLEGELGYFLNKTQDLGDSALNGYGFSSAILSAKVSLYNDISSMFEITTGAGLKIPMSTRPMKRFNVTLPNDIQPSSGAYGGLIHLFIRKGFRNPDFNTFFIGRAEFNGTNSYRFPYKYGNTYISSFFITRRIVDNLSGIIQLRNEYRNKDVSDGEINDHTGSSLLFISPQLGYKWNDWDFSILYDYPIYKRYNGTQLSTDYSISFNISTRFNVFDEDPE